MNFDTQDEARLNFVRGKAHQLQDLSLREAQLVDEISEDIDRELKPFERHTVDRLMARFKEQRLK
jgi:hypothetical protein